MSSGVSMGISITFGKTGYKHQNFVIINEIKAETIWFKWHLIFVWMEERKKGSRGE